MENLPSMKMYCISSGKIGIFQPVMLGFRGVKIVYQLDTKIPPKIKNWPSWWSQEKAVEGHAEQKMPFWGRRTYCSDYIKINNSTEKKQGNLHQIFSGGF